MFAVEVASLLIQSDILVVSVMELDKLKRMKNKDLREQVFLNAAIACPKPG